MSDAARCWNIAETHRVVKRKTADGDKFVNNYRLLQTLGQGRFGKVKLCERLPVSNGLKGGRATVSDATDGSIAGNPMPSPAFVPPKPRRFAIKIFSKKMLRRLKDYCAEPAAKGGEGGTEEDDVPTRMRAVTALDRVRDEIEIMRSLYHRNIVLLFEVIEADDSDKLYMVLEHMAFGPCMVYRPETKDFYSRATGATLTENLARSYLADILHGLEYLHERRICHRDIKPDNILLSDAGRCHLTDFGCAKSFGSSLHMAPGGESGAALVTDTVGTYQFLAPECCCGEPYDPFKVDIWAVGVVYYIFLFGKLPFTSDRTRELFDEIVRAEIVVSGEDCGREQEVSPEGQNLLRRMLEKDPSQRITIAQALIHPWFYQSEDDEEPLSF